MYVLATAGHVDHGKSALVAALTGINPDRLVEEKVREMTIDLGFAWLTLPDGNELGIIDVPGHKDFIENMLAGIGGIDAVLLIVAADEGIMPQTREHLNIINLLEKEKGIIALTKVDLIQDTEWLDYVELELRNSLAGSVLANAPIVKVSSKTGDGIEELKIQIVRLMTTIPPKNDVGKPRLPIDRVFSLSGFGTIVTGTLLDGSFKTGESVVIQPAGVVCRIRGLQTHKHKEVTAKPGTRTAVNISGVDVDQLGRGDVLTYPNQYQPTRRVDARVHLIDEAGTSLKHNDSIKFFIGTSERVVRVRVLGIESLKPGESGWVQIESEEAFIAEKDDKFILRRMSPPETIGGGIILDAHPTMRYKLNDEKILLRFESLLRGSPGDRILSIMMDGKPHSIQEIIQKTGFSPSEGMNCISSLQSERQIVILNDRQDNLKPGDLIMSVQGWEKISRKNEKLLQDYHARYPLRMGMPFEEWKSKLGFSGEAIPFFIENWEKNGIVVFQQYRMRLAVHAVHYTSSQEKKKMHLWEEFDKDRFNPPSVEKCKENLSEELFNCLIETGELILVSDETVLRVKEFYEMLEYVKVVINTEGVISVAHFRDHFLTSRKYSLALLEYLDRRGITQRVGDGRVLVEQK